MEVFKNSDPIVEIGPDWLARLKAEAANSPRQRARICLHIDENDAVQEMILALGHGVLYPPHRHRNKTESFHIIEGELDLIIFNDVGDLVRVVQMGPVGSGKTFCYRLNSSMYHTPLPRTPFVIFHETTTGPFRTGDSQVAPWAPVGDQELREFLEASLQRGRSVGPRSSSTAA